MKLTFVAQHIVTTYGARGAAVLELYTQRVECGDCIIAAAVEEFGGNELLSYDAGFNQTSTPHS